MQESNPPQPASMGAGEQDSGGPRTDHIESVRKEHGTLEPKSESHDLPALQFMT